MTALSTTFTSLLAESLALPPTAFSRFFTTPPAAQQHKLKIIRYPDLDELRVPAGADGAEREGSSQGVGPHKDSLLTSYLLQASAHAGLQAQNWRGEWIDCPPVPGTLVVALGQAMEAVTGGVCAATTHRVLSPGRGLGSRYSVPFFQGVSFECDFQTLEIPREVVEQKRRFVESGGGEWVDNVDFGLVKGRWNCFGEAILWNRARSHMDVTEKWYPDLYKRIKEEQEGKKGGSDSDGEKGRW